MYPDDARSFDVGDDPSSMDASEIPNFFNTMMPTAARIYIYLSGNNDSFAAGVVVSPYGHILTATNDMITDTDKKIEKIYVFFQSQEEEFKAAICHEYDDAPFLLLKLESERDDFPYARLASSAPVEGSEIHLIHNESGGSFHYLKGMVSCPRKNLSSTIRRSDLYSITPCGTFLINKSVEIPIVEVGAIYDSTIVCGSPFFSKNGSIVGLYFFSAFDLAYGFHLDYLKMMSHIWEQKITQCQPAKRIKLTTDGLASSTSQSGHWQHAL